MKAVFQSFLLVLASATDRELARQVQFLKVENQILRGRLPKRITVTPQERQRLIKYGRPLGTAIKELISIVSPRTFLRWLSAEQPAAPKPRKPGRPRTEAEIRDLVLKLARETGWGYSRILGELKKLGVRRICRSTVINILKEHGLDPGPQRGEDSWDAFLKRHAATLWACDFFSKRIWTTAGLVEFYILFVRHDNRDCIAGSVSKTLGRRCLSRPTYLRSKDVREHSLLVKRRWMTKCPDHAPQGLRSKVKARLLEPQFRPDHM